MKDNSIKLVSLGFITIMILMFALTVISQHQIRENNRLLSSLITQTNVKIQAVNAMRDSIRMRENIMQKMQLTDDVFARDELYMDFLNFAGIYKAARRKLLNSSLDEKEKNELKKLDELTRQAQPINDVAAETLVASPQNSRLKKYVTDSIRLQTETLKILDHLVEIENRNAVDSHHIAINEYKQTSYIIYSLTITAFLLCIYVIWKVVHNVRRINNEITHQATHDNLTGLVNRYEFENRVRTALHRAKIDDRQHSLLFMDLDQFKAINDTCGHLAGDHLLQKIPLLVNSIIRQHDTLARLGGDEFGLLMEDCSIEKAVLMAEEIREKILNFHFLWDGRNFTIGISIGITSINSQTKDLQQIFTSADTACYMAKENGRNLVHIYNEKDEKLLKQQKHMQWISRLTDGMENNNFCLYFQPIESLKTSGKAAQHSYYEALIRYKDDNGKIYTPDNFLPAAERFGKIQLLDQWVITQAIKTFSENRFISSESMLSINLSGRSINNEKLLKHIKTQIKNNNINARRICFEITETEVIASLDNAIELMKEIKSLGCQFALDDFGSGLSSFNYLKNLPVDILKIDGAFIRNILNDPIDRAIVKSMYEVAKTMNIKTVAEFVEDRKTIELLREMGIDYVQGYAISKPIPELPTHH